MKCLTASWLSIAFSDTDLMLQLCLPNEAPQLHTALTANSAGAPDLCSAVTVSSYLELSTLHSLIVVSAAQSESHGIS